MTRVEAINFLSNLSVFQSKESDYRKALDMAIEALKNQPKFIIHSNGTIEQINSDKGCKFKVFNVGGNPDNDFCLYEKLMQLVNDLQSNGFRIERIDYHEISRAWSIEGKYKKTSEYIIVATESEGYK